MLFKIHILICSDIIILLKTLLYFTEVLLTIPIQEEVIFKVKISKLSIAPVACLIQNRSQS